MRRCQNEKAFSDLMFDGPHITGGKCQHPSYKGMCGLDYEWKGGDRGVTENSCCTRACNNFADCKVRYSVLLTVLAVQPS
jgi:hypothetical protein